jgi:hypothetical protein
MYCYVRAEFILNTWASTSRAYFGRKAAAVGESSTSRSTPEITFWSTTHRHRQEIMVSIEISNPIHPTRTGPTEHDRPTEQLCHRPDASPRSPGRPGSVAQSTTSRDLRYLGLTAHFTRHIRS